MKKAAYARAYAILRVEFEPAGEPAMVPGSSQFSLRTKVKEIVADEETAKAEVLRLNRLMRQAIVELAEGESGDEEDLFTGGGGYYCYQPTRLRFGPDDHYALVSDKQNRG